MSPIDARSSRHAIALSFADKRRSAHALYAGAGSRGLAPGSTRMTAAGHDQADVPAQASSRTVCPINPTPAAGSLFRLAKLTQQQLAARRVPALGLMGRGRPA